MSPDSSICLIGSTGQFGKSFANYCLARSVSVLGLSRSEVQPASHFDLARPNIGALQLRERGVTHAIVAAGVTSVDRCASDPVTTRAINVVGTIRLIEQLWEHGIFPIFLSSDYVFDGDSGSYTESSRICPCTQYGAQKAEVEDYIATNGLDKSLILRLGRILSRSTDGSRFLSDIVERLMQRMPVRAATDQVFTPVVADDLSQACLALIDCQSTGIVHVTAGEAWSRYEVALCVAESMGYGDTLVMPSALRDIAGQEGRPRNTTLSTQRSELRGIIGEIPIRRFLEDMVNDHFLKHGAG